MTKERSYFVFDEVEQISKEEMSCIRRTGKGIKDLIVSGNKRTKGHHNIAAGTVVGMAMVAESLIACAPKQQVSTVTDQNKIVIKDTKPVPGNGTPEEKYELVTSMQIAVQPSGIDPIKPVIPDQISVPPPSFPAENNKVTEGQSLEEKINKLLPDGYERDDAAMGKIENAVFTVADKGYVLPNNKLALGGIARAFEMVYGKNDPLIESLKILPSSYQAKEAFKKYPKRFAVIDVSQFSPGELKSIKSSLLYIWNPNPKSPYDDINEKDKDHGTIFALLHQEEGKPRRLASNRFETLDLFEKMGPPSVMVVAVKEKAKPVNNFLTQTPAEIEMQFPAGNEKDENPNLPKAVSDNGRKVVKPIEQTPETVIISPNLGIKPISIVPSDKQPEIAVESTTHPATPVIAPSTIVKVEKAAQPPVVSEIAHPVVVMEPSAPKASSVPSQDKTSLASENVSKTSDTKETTKSTSVNDEIPPVVPVQADIKNDKKTEITSDTADKPAQTPVEKSDEQQKNTPSQPTPVPQSSPATDTTTRSDVNKNSTPKNGSADKTAKVPDKSSGQAKEAAQPKPATSNQTSSPIDSSPSSSESKKPDSTIDKKPVESSTSKTQPSPDTKPSGSNTTSPDQTPKKQEPASPGTKKDTAPNPAPKQEPAQTAPNDKKPDAKPSTSSPAQPTVPTPVAEQKKPSPAPKQEPTQPPVAQKQPEAQAPAPAATQRPAPAQVLEQKKPAPSVAPAPEQPKNNEAQELAKYLQYLKDKYIKSNIHFASEKKRDEFVDRVEKIARKNDPKGIFPDFANAIMKSIGRESHFDPKAQSKNSDATGLIQWMNRRDEILKLTLVEQLDLVDEYYSLYKGKYVTEMDAYSRIFCPIAVGHGPDFVCYSKFSKDQIIIDAYYANSSVDFDGDGNITAGEAYSAVLATEKRDFPDPYPNPRKK